VQVTHVDALDAEHPVEAVRAAAVALAPHGLALADHDIVLILHLPLPVAVLVGLDELPHGRQLLAPRQPRAALILLLLRGARSV
jgi:hypothetical protein